MYDAGIMNRIMNKNVDIKYSAHYTFRFTITAIFLYVMNVFMFLHNILQIKRYNFLVKSNIIIITGICR
jgi:hypothetical protein